MEKRLVRNVQDKKIAGVCAGIGKERFFTRWISLV